VSITTLQIQKRLKELGFDPGPIDGLPGRRTTAGIKAFQRAHPPLTVDGIVGPKTTTVLFPAIIIGKEVMPPWITLGKSLIGLHEVNNAKNLDKLMKLDTSAIPWCGAFVAYLIATTLPEEVIPTNPLWALNWLKFGKSLGITEVLLGSIAVFKRDGGGHVGIVVGHDPTAYHILGGNQSNKVSIARVSKGQCRGLREPLTFKLSGPVLKQTTLAGSIETNLA